MSEQQQPKPTIVVWFAQAATPLLAWFNGEDIGRFLYAAELLKLGAIVAENETAPGPPGPGYHVEGLDVDETQVGFLVEFEPDESVGGIVSLGRPPKPIHFVTAATFLEEYGRHKMRVALGSLDDQQRAAAAARRRILGSQN